MKKLIMIVVLLLSVIPQLRAMSIFFYGEKHFLPKDAKLPATDTVSKNQNLPDTSKVFTLTDVIVKASNVIQKSDRIILLPSSNMQKASSSAWDLLSKIKLPGVIIDRQNKNATTIDGSNILFKINNVDATIAEYLTIAPNDVKKIEYIDKLGARYSDRNISAIINVITKRHSSGGQFGVYEDAALTTMSLYNSAYVKFNKANSQFSLSYNSKYRDYNDSYTDTYLRNDDIAIFRKGIDSPYGYFLQNINATYNYYKNGFTFNAKITYSTNHNTNQNSSQEIYYNEKMEDERFSLTDYVYGGKIVFYWKNFSANVAFNHSPKELSGMKRFYGESTGSIDCSYKYKKLTFSLGLWNPLKNYVAQVMNMQEMAYINLNISESRTTPTWLPLALLMT